MELIGGEKSSVTDNVRSRVRKFEPKEIACHNNLYLSYLNLITSLIYHFQKIKSEHTAKQSAIAFEKSAFVIPKMCRDRGGKPMIKTLRGKKALDVRSQNVPESEVPREH